MQEAKPEKSYFAHPTAEIAGDAMVGVGTYIWHNCQVMSGAKIGDNCKLGKSVYVDFGVQIGSGVKIQNGISIYKGVTIEDDVLLGPHMAFTNDLYPRAFNDEYEVVPTLVKTGASIGANATIICGVVLGRYCMVGAGAVVTTDVPDYGLVVGNPANVVGYVCQCGARLSLDYKRRRNREVKCDRCGTQFRIDPGAVSTL